MSSEASSRTARAPMGSTAPLSDGTGKGDIRSAAVSSCEHHAHGHTFRQIVDGNSKRQHRRLRQMRAHTLRLVCADMQVRRQFVDKQQESHTKQETNGRRKHRPLAAIQLHRHRWNQQRPHRCSDHHARCKAQQAFLHTYRHLASHKEYEGRAKHRAQQRNQQSYD